MALDHTVLSELSRESERIEEDAVFSGKGHYNTVGPWRWVHRILGLAAAVGSTLAAVAVLKQWCPDVAVVASAVSALAAVVLTILKPSEEADRHQRAGDRYLATKNRARIFRNIELRSPDATDAKAQDSIRALSSTLDDIRSGAPPIPHWAYEKAKRDVEVNKTAEYRVDRTPQP